LELDVLPGKGGDVLALRWLPLGLDLLWTTPWGLPERGALLPQGSTERFLRSYPGGWQTLFPNGGDPSIESGVEWGFHGEACMVPWDVHVETSGDDLARLRLGTTLESVPFTLERSLDLTPEGLLVRESARNTGASAIEVMWSHHPAFGAPFLSGAARVECAARTFVADAERDVAGGDLLPGATSAWPLALTRDGGRADLRVLPGPGGRLDRFGYLTDLREGFAAITNDDLALRAELRWDASIFPHAWYWLEANATQGPPWFGEAYVFAIEPASSFPGHGVASVRRAGGRLLRFDPGEEKTVTMSLIVSAP
jgi:galactose mutarotase-like enzyme